METGRVLIISSHPLFAEAITHLLQEEGMNVVASVDSLEKAVPVLEAQQIETIIVDQDDPQIPDSAVVSQLVGSRESQQVIFLTLAGNQMIVHHRERMENITPTDLIRAIRFSKDEPS